LTKLEGWNLERPFSCLIRYEIFPFVFVYGDNFASILSEAKRWSAFDVGGHVTEPELTLELEGPRIEST